MIAFGEVEKSVCSDCYDRMSNVTVLGQNVTIQKQIDTIQGQNVTVLIYFDISSRRFNILPELTPEDTKRRLTTRHK